MTKCHRFRILFAVSAFCVAGFEQVGVLGVNNPHDQSSAVKVPPAAVKPSPAETSAVSTRQISAALSAADELIERQDLAVYRGWLKYLKFRAQADPVRMGANSAEAKAAFSNLVDWTAKIKADPKVIRKLRGVQEWAYESQADGSGQPFKINIPTDYDPAHPAGLSINCHGYSGNHMEHSVGMMPHPGRFEVAVLGRARGGMYRMLAERDVLDVFEYVKATWKIDENRVDLSGGSMGGFASMWFGSRYPDLFACVRPSCGWALNTPVENMLNLPVYSLHSKDDPVVHVVDSCSPLQQLSNAGGMVIIEETNGFGHGVWGWMEGQARSGAWGERQVRPEPTSVREISYTAIDGVATGAWWAHVAEWGAKQAPAIMRLRLGPANILYGSLSNITRLRLDIAKSPIDRAQPLLLSLNTAKTVTLPVPLPDRVDIVVGPSGARFETPANPKVRPRTPGAAAMVYDGSPLLIVYGTQGDADANAKMVEAANAASKSPNSSWPVDQFENAPQDGVSHYQNLYGQLIIKADRTVTDADIASHNLVLIGTASQNSTVARVAAQLPVKEAGDAIKTSDGFTYAATNNAWALIHFNPLSPHRLLLWIASEDKEFYQAGALLPRELFNHGSGADFIIMSPEGRVFAARSFDQTWNWSASYAQSPLLPKAATTKAGWSTLLANILRTSVGADFGSAMVGYKSNWLFRDSFMSCEGATRYADMALLHYQMRILTVDVKGSDLLVLKSRLEARPDAPLCMSSNFASAKLDPDRMYSVTVDWDSLPPLSELLGVLPQSGHATGVWEAEAIETFSHSTAIENQ